MFFSPLPYAHQVHKKDGVRIRYKKMRSDNCEEVEFADMAKAYEKWQNWPLVNRSHTRGRRRRK